MTTTKTTPKKRGRPPKSTGPKLPAKAKAKPRVKTPAAAPATDSLPINPFIHEVLSLADAQKSNAKKVEVLKNYEHDCLKSMNVMH